MPAPNSHAAGSYARLSIFYLGYFVAGGFYFPFVSLFYRSLGFGGSQIGLLAALGPLAGIAMGPVWGYLADVRGWSAPLLRVALLASALCAPLLLLPHTFALVALLVALLALCLSPTIPLADATTLQWIRAGGKATYGQIRLWGSVGFIAGGLIGGQVFAVTSVRYLFGFYGVLLLAPFLASLTFGRSRGSRIEQSRGRGVLSLLRHPVLGPFYLLVFLAYGTAAAYNAFFALYLQHLGAGAGLIGVAIAIGSVSELPVMWYSGRIIGRLGPRVVFLGALYLYAVRWFLLSLIHDPLLALATQLLHGPTFAAYFVAGITFVDRHVPENLRASGQTLFSASTFGLASIVGSLTFGFILDRAGLFHMYAIAGVLCTCATTLLALLVRD